MCGICGIVNLDGLPVPQKQVEEMCQALTHRGPDDEGFYFSNDTSSSSATPKAGFGFKRLSILDLSGGRQPMRLDNLTIVFNGEIYNYRELKEECESLGHRFRTQCDTEVLLHLFSIHREKALEKLRGMFAFAIWDNQTKELFLARDPLGIKPLTYFFNGKNFIFSSEIKSLMHSGIIPLEWDAVSVLDFFRYRFTPSPHTILKNVYKLPPAHFLKLKGGELSLKRYWHCDPKESLKKSEADWEEELLAKLEESVQMQMVSDVPLGALLSGGVDSSLIVALMAKKRKEKIQTFSIGFGKGTGVDESAYASQVAQTLGTDHHEYILTEKDLESTGDILSHMSEPVADPTLLPTALVSKFARRHVKVVLTGEGGDELFAGYNRYKAVLYNEWIAKLPRVLKGAVSALARHAGRGEAFRNIPNLTPKNWFSINQDFNSIQLESIFHSQHAALFKETKITSHPYFKTSHSKDLLNSILSLEQETSLADRLLMKVDMASMSESLEARPPYLDHTLVEFSSQIPSSLKIKFFKGKYILRKCASRFLPPEIAWRKKHGFIVPLAKWVWACPKETVESLLDCGTLEKTGLFNSNALFKLSQKINAQTATEMEIALAWPLMVLSTWIRSLKKS